MIILSRSEKIVGGIVGQVVGKATRNTINLRLGSKHVDMTKILVSSTKILIRSTKILI